MKLLSSGKGRKEKDIASCFHEFFWVQPQYNFLLDTILKTAPILENPT